MAALADYHKSRAKIERLIAQPVSETITKK
jgi:hypothetical protein